MVPFQRGGYCRCSLHSGSSFSDGARLSTRLASGSGLSFSSRSDAPSIGTFICVCADLVSPVPLGTPLPLYAVRRLEAEAPHRADRCNLLRECLGGQRGRGLYVVVDSLRVASLAVKVAKVIPAQAVARVGLRFNPWDEA